MCYVKSYTSIIFNSSLTSSSMCSKDKCLYAIPMCFYNWGTDPRTQTMSFMFTIISLAFQSHKLVLSQARQYYNSDIGLNGCGMESVAKTRFPLKGLVCLFCWLHIKDLQCYTKFPLLLSLEYWKIQKQWYECRFPTQQYGKGNWGRRNFYTKQGNCRNSYR